MASYKIYCFPLYLALERELTPTQYEFFWTMIDLSNEFDAHVAMSENAFFEELSHYVATTDRSLLDRVSRRYILTF